MSDVIDFDCCGDTEQTNPKTDLFGRRSKGLDPLFKLKNPIPDEVTDSKGLRSIFKNWNLIPYSGTTANSGHNLLNWYLLLARLSPTNSASIEKKIKYSVGGKARIVRSVDPEFDTGEEAVEVTTAEAVAYVDTLKKFFDFDGGISSLSRRIGWQYEATGNSFVELSIAQVGGETRFYLKAHKTTNVLFVNTKPGDAKVVAVSPVWEDKYLERNPPRVVPIYPVIAKGEDGVLRSMFQLKAGTNTWYGRPPSSGADIYKYREVQDSIYQVKVVASDFTGRLIIEVEDDSPEFAPAIEDQNAERAGYEGFAERWAENFTNSAENPQSVVVSSRPYGSKPMFVFQVSPNTKESWYQVTGKIAEEKILRANQVTPRFMGVEVSSGFSSDVYLSDYLLNMEPVITELHNVITNFINSILSAGWNFIGMGDQDVFSIAFAPPIQSALKDFKERGAPSGTEGPLPVQAPKTPDPAPEDKPNNTENN